MRILFFQQWTNSMLLRYAAGFNKASLARICCRKGLEFIPQSSTTTLNPDVASHIFKRPFLFVEPNTRMLQIATFLAIGPQIYVDGVIVMDDKVQRETRR
ncbi:MAG: hypothetical protein WA667_05805 [Candidatus Nitrosopolaris sp.]